MQPENPRRSRSGEGFLAKIGTHLPKTRPIDAEDAARAVFQIL
jgi:uncharacterized protein (DUF2267 family)